MTKRTCANCFRFIWAMRVWRLRRWPRASRQRRDFAKSLLTEPFDLTILDLHLVGEDGLDVLSFIKRNDPKHPVVIYSGVDENELAQKKAFLGLANGVVRKMSSLASLLAEVLHHLPKSSSTGEAHSEPVPRS